MGRPLDVLDMPFEGVLSGLRLRIRNALRKDGKRTFRDVVSMSEEDFIKLSGVGFGSLKILREELACKGYAFGDLHKLPASQEAAQEAVPMASDMTLRDHFAGQALHGILNLVDRRFFEDIDWDVLAHTSYLMADAMLKEKAKAETTDKERTNENGKA